MSRTKAFKSNPEDEEITNPNAKRIIEGMKRIIALQQRKEGIQTEIEQEISDLQSDFSAFLNDTD